MCKTFRGLFGRPGKEALRGVDLEVSAGTAFGLIGLNGAGKTTFIKILLAIVHPDGGEVEVLSGSPQDLSVRRRIGYLPERLHLPGAWTPRHFLRSVARMKGIRHAHDEVERQLGRVGMRAEGSRRMKGFSKGMRQRVGLAAALLGEPDLLVLDEPTDGVDPLGRVEVRRLLAEERARGATLFLNSHLLAETERICDHIGILSAGRLVCTGPLEALAGRGDRYRLRFAPGYDPERLCGLGFENGDESDVWRITATRPEEVSEAVVKARQAGAHVVEVGPDTRDLESILAEVVER
ncbi:MAG: ABC transporter ATP-binding protein [Deltaproteobacteria bacterium]|nr:MAG: ABC transporter ATP-binding protein [Deltaproteobacteria bacterium]